jgi:hypothetical protein
MFPAGHKPLARNTTARKPTEPTADIDQWEGKKKGTEQNLWSAE